VEPFATDEVGVQHGLTSEEDRVLAKKRGESHGFEDIFLSNFIERELVMMIKWKARQRYEVAEPTNLVLPGDQKPEPIPLTSQDIKRINKRRKKKQEDAQPDIQASKGP